MKSNLVHNLYLSWIAFLVISSTSMLAYRWHRTLDYSRSFSGIESLAFESEMKKSAMDGSQAIRDLSNPSKQEIEYALKLESFASSLDEQSIVPSSQERDTLDRLLKQTPDSLGPGYDIFGYVFGAGAAPLALLIFFHACRQVISEFRGSDRTE